MSIFNYTKEMITNVVKDVNIVHIKSHEKATSEAMKKVIDGDYRAMYDIENDVIILNDNDNLLFRATSAISGDRRGTIAHELLHRIQVQNWEIPRGQVVLGCILGDELKEFHYEMELDAHALELAFTSYWKFLPRFNIMLNALAEQYGFASSMNKTAITIAKELRARIEYFRANKEIFEPLFAKV